MKYKPHIQKGELFWKAWSKEYSYFTDGGVEVFPCAFGNTPEKAYMRWVEMMSTVSSVDKMVVVNDDGYVLKVGWICTLALILSFPISFVLLCFVLK